MDDHERQDFEVIDYMYIILYSMRVAYARAC
jgi:hypothetical protein